MLADFGKSSNKTLHFSQFNIEIRNLPKAYAKQKHLSALASMGPILSLFLYSFFLIINLSNILPLYNPD